MRFEHLLLPVDLDGDHDALVAAAKALALPLGAHLHLLHVLDLPPSVHPDVLLRPAAHPATTARLAEERQAVQPALRALCQALADDGCPVHARIAHGDPTQAILAAADPDRIDLIVMGTHARRGLMRAALGSVAATVIRDALVPVLTVRQGVRPDAPALSFHDLD